MQVFINGEKTGDLSMTKAVMDITPWLKNGENTIALLYSSSLLPCLLSCTAGQKAGLRRAGCVCYNGTEMKEGK